MLIIFLPPSGLSILLEDAIIILNYFLIIGISSQLINIKIITTQNLHTFVLLKMGAV